MKYKVGETVLIVPLMRFAKIVAIRKVRSVVTLWLKSGDYEFSLSTLRGENNFALQAAWPREDTQNVSVYRLSSIIELLGWIVLGLALIALFAK
ncbi:hypothetical protein HYQ22_gp128 [Acinetobacter phage vB_AbaM_Kimel]|uniref:Uncharacterized protein n=3 Tax=Lazarusvirus kimel TaxID=2843635 RepID=A0A6B9LWN0_9CAUD|nr:hypothetical protein HYQ22_gp128 [Acinetobacter phage vB_AbaM_Kimel]QHB48283.1 hypothetical protein Kimel_128 [Acinetobacter phage vB_AbaM_Kimel]QKE55826.1 hypothetical protein Octan_124 [Acinetobacter phage Octan]QNO11245.1 hypothetical protein Meroveus_124 [Acinetobacter phage Meroveus]